MALAWKVQRVCAVWFSPTGGTRRLTETLADLLAAALGVTRRDVDFTLPPARDRSYGFAPSDLVVLGMPTYAGKLPNLLLPYVGAGFSGGGAMAVPLVTFGNRGFDNALAELSACLKETGFSPMAGGAFVARHVFSKTLAAGRPDARDLAALSAFGAAILQKLRTAEAPGEAIVPGDAAAPYYTPLGTDGAPAKFLKTKPKTDAARCNGCGVCAAVCPMGAIDPAAASEVPGICIKCHACIRHCPQSAKYFDDPAFLSHRQMLEETYTRRIEPVWFL